MNEPLSRGVAAATMGNHSLVLHRRFVVALLACIYGTAFVLSPYWTLPASWIARAFLLIGIVALGAAWLAAGAGEVRLRFTWRGILGGVALLTALWFLDYRALAADIPWRGDEGAHISRTQLLAGWVPGPVFLAGLVLFLLVLAAAWRNPGWGARAGVLALAAGIVFVTSSPQFGGPDNGWITHYPLLNYWAYALPVELVGPIGGIYQEALYRVIPFLSMAGIAWLVQRELDDTSWPVRALWALAAATIPIILYYSSVLYVEPLAVFLMVVVSLRSRELIERPASQLKSMPSWYALILIGFIRDTTLIFLMGFLAARLIYQWRHTPSSDGAPGRRSSRAGRLAAAEAGIVAAVLLPYGLFMALKYSLTGSDRAYAPSWHVLSDVSVYRAVAQSWLEQFGAWLVLCLAGCVLLWRRKQPEMLSFLAGLLLIYPAFHALDGSGQYAGYSRFNLFMAGPLIAGATVAAKALNSRSTRLAVLGACALIALNLLLSPVHLDGSKIPLWGTYFRDTAEHYYPYDETLRWLKDNAGGRRILFSGMDYGYSFDFYFQKLDWAPRHQVRQVMYTGNPADEFRMVFPWNSARPERSLDALWGSGAVPTETEQLTTVLHDAAEGRFGIVVYQVLGDSLPNPDDTAGYVMAKAVSNEAHTLLVYLAGR